MQKDLFPLFFIHFPRISRYIACRHPRLYMKQAFSLLVVLLCISPVLPQSSSLSVNGGNSAADRGGFATNQKLLNLISALDRIPNSSVYENVAISDISGSMFYEPNFTVGTIYLNGKPYATLPMRYNALNDEFEVKEDNTVSKAKAIAKTKSVSCKKGNDYFVFKEYIPRNGAMRTGYLIELISDGKYKLYEKRAKVFKEGSDAKTSFHKSTPHRFLDKIDFFISKGENAPVLTKKSKKDILSFLDKEDAQRLKQFLKSKKGMDFGNTRELASIISLLNSESSF